MTRNSLCAVVVIVLVAGMAVPVVAEEKPSTKVEILQPKPSETLTGTVDVQVKITPVPAGRFPSVVYAGLGGPPSPKESPCLEPN